MIEPWVFWLVAALTIPPSFALLFARKPVHIAVAVVVAMLGLAIAYVALDAPFLGVVQIVVYTGAVMMLFIFVLMLVGVDQRENLKETLKNQRWVGLALAAGTAFLLSGVVARVSIGTQPDGAPSDPQDVARSMFGPYVVIVETLAFVLIAAAVGALVLTFVPRLKERVTQRSLQADRIASGDDPVNKPMPGVYARHNALDAPALDPSGGAIEDSVSRVLEVRHQTVGGSAFRDQALETRRELGLDAGEGAEATDADATDADSADADSADADSADPGEKS